MIEKILIVDDSKMARNITKRSLEICGLTDINILEAENGEEALKLLKDDSNFDVVFTDLNMPIMDGEQLLKRIKSSPKLFEIPVVVITSKNNPANKRQLILDHATAVLSKPIHLPELFDVLNSKLKPNG